MLAPRRSTLNHGSVSIRRWENGPEKYIDPEPLIALWPLRVPIDGGDSALVTTVAAPGIPLGSAPPRSKRAAKGERAVAGPTAAPAGDETVDEAETPEPSEEE